MFDPAVPQSWVAVCVCGPRHINGITKLSKDMKLCENATTKYGKFQ